MEQIQISEKEAARLKKAGGVNFTDIYGAEYIILNNVILRATIMPTDNVDN